MSHRRRRFRAAGRLLPALIGGAAIVVWLSTYYRCHEFRLGTGRPWGVWSLSVYTAPGRLGFARYREELTVSDPHPRRGRTFVWRHASYAPGGYPPFHLLLPRRATRESFGASAGPVPGLPAIWRVDTFNVPIWPAAVVVGAWLVVRARMWHATRGRRARGQCVGCGYDLRASPDRCPECGTSTAGGVT